MLLDPVSSRGALPLNDEDAAPPEDLPRGDELEKKIDKVTARLGELQKVLNADASRSLLIILQGRDASGKDGVVGAVFDACNAQGVRVNSFKVPTATELAHDYLWRVHQVVPEKGMIGIFNRSHYEDVLVVRVHNLVPKEVWSKRFDQINDFERMLADNGVVILKFFLHVSHDAQRQRLIDRIEDPTKNWKFKAGDLDERKLWEALRVDSDVRLTGEDGKPAFGVEFKSVPYQGALLVPMINHLKKAQTVSLAIEGRKA